MLFIMNNNQISKFVIGIIMLQILVKLLKNIIKQSRPIKSKTFGMPSTRAAVISFICIFIYLHNKNINNTTLYILIIVPIVSCLMKYVLKEHSFLQLLIGSIIGICFAIFIKHCIS